MIKVNYTELDGPAGPTCRLEASGHAGYAPAGQDIVCAGASTLMQTLCALLAGEEGTRSGVWDEPDGPRLAVTAAAPQKPWVEGAFEFAKAGFASAGRTLPGQCPLRRFERTGRTVDGGFAALCLGGRRCRRPLRSCPQPCTGSAGHRLRDYEGG